MVESVDVKSLKAMFTSKAGASDTSFQPPQPGYGRASLPVGKGNSAHHRLSPLLLSPPMAGPGPVRLPNEEPVVPSIPARPASFPRPPLNPGLRPGLQPADASKVKQTGEMLQNLMLRQQRPPGTKPLLPGTKPPSSPAQSPVAAFSPSPRQSPRPKISADVSPLRRPLPPDGALPLKPKRPPNVNLKPFLRFKRGSSLPDQRQRDAGSPFPPDRKLSLPATMSPPKLPHRHTKPSRLPRQVASIDMDNNLTYDDIGSLEQSESCSGSSHCIDGDTEDVYESIEEDQVETNQVTSEGKKEALRKDQQRKMENEFKKIFQLPEEVEVLHIARVRHDWYGEGKLDLSVRQDEKVEILRVKDNPGGKWLARSLTGNYGYISNTCVDIDYEAVKRKFQYRVDLTQLPPPPPDPPQMPNMKSYNRDSANEDEDDYDDIQQPGEDFPPPPPDIRTDPKLEKELRKKFKYEGPLRTLHTMMVDPNGIIKKLGGKDLPVIRGEIVDVIQFTSSKKVLCCNQYGKYGYVSKSLLLPMEGDIYDDIDCRMEIYDNDSPHPDF
ncbi:hypothetical protein fugu_006022 [Takifugu bimaculatus]|uniref:SH3 domain-containing protein n=1 Tax=Takifugu bimaculatus TaxID=433685 RepID=A0A4Z2B603_9TELE|nr:hypothetical protein fugu_006022 [Takifugu bimaculatus]